jgi:hypothetical protein
MPAIDSDGCRPVIPTRDVQCFRDIGMGGRHRLESVDGMFQNREDYRRRRQEPKGLGPRLGSSFSQEKEMPMPFSRQRAGPMSVSKPCRPSAACRRRISWAMGFLTVILRYDPDQGYGGAGPRFPQAYDGDVAATIEQLQPFDVARLV